MTIITTRLTVAPDGTVSLSERLPTGEHQARVFVQPLPDDQVAAEADLSWLPQLDIGGNWPPGLTFSRDEIYGDDGR